MVITGSPSFSNNIPIRTSINNSSILLNSLGNEELEDLKNSLWDNFDIESLQDLLKKEVEELEKTSSRELKESRVLYIKELIKNLIQKETKEELNNFKYKIERIVDTNSLEWKMRATIELIFSEEWIFDSWFEDKPFYIEENELKIWVDTAPWKIIIWHPEIIKWLDNPENVKEELNKIYAEVKTLIQKSNGDMKKYIWILFDIIKNPENITKYKNELWEQPWYNDYLNKVS